MAQLNAILTDDERDALLDSESADNYSSVLAALDERISTELHTDLRLLQQNEPHLYEAVLQEVNRSFDDLVDGD